MKVDLSHEDLVNLVGGYSPAVNVTSCICGSINGGPYHGQWVWDWGKLRKLTEEQLWGLYLTCKRTRNEYQKKMDERLKKLEEKANDK